MTVQIDTIDRFKTMFQQVATDLPGDKRLMETRTQALQAFADRGIPTSRDEDWKYTNLRPLAKRDFRHQSESTHTHVENLEGVMIAGLDAHRLVFVNGKYRHDLSTDDVSGSNIPITRLAGVLANDGVDLLASETRADIHRFSALNTAFVEDGANIVIPANDELDKPVYLVFISAPSEPEIATHPRIFIDTGANSSCTVIEHFVGLDDASNFTNAVTRVRCGRGSSVTHYKLQEESTKGFHIQTIHADLQSDSTFTSHNVALGGALARTNIHTALNGPGAMTVLNGLFMAGGRQHIDNHTRIDHAQPHTTSQEDYRGVLDGRGRGVFNGKVVVHKDAQKTDAQQSNTNLLLSEHAEIDTKPELEIYADDVKCSHGATVGQLDKDALFYLLTRGIDPTTARDLLTYAFAADVIQRIDNPAIRERIEQTVVGRLPDSERIKELV